MKWPWHGHVELYSKICQHATLSSQLTSDNKRLWRYLLSCFQLQSAKAWPSEVISFLRLQKWPLPHWILWVACQGICTEVHQRSWMLNFNSRPNGKNGKWWHPRTMLQTFPLWLQYRLWKVWLYQVHVTAGRFQRTFSLAKNLESIGPSWGDVTYKEHCKRQRQEISRGAVLYKN